MTEQPRTLAPFSTHWGTYFAEVEGGRVVGVKDYAGDPDPAVIGPGIVEAVHHRVRIAEPVVRKGYLENGPGSDRSGRGREPFVAVSWEEASALAAAGSIACGKHTAIAPSSADPMAGRAPAGSTMRRASCTGSSMA